ncbi:tetratricopeptide repeat protein [Candidatus Parcubacteria bacterium]|nr:MAG: tetratricopeptide repeat protein [Candidatus Parcubacteria bacterium]
MSTCKFCRRGGLFVRTDENGLCTNCAPKVIKKVEALFASYPRLLDIAKRPTLGLSKRLRYLTKAIEIMEELHRTYETRDIRTTTPSPSTVLEELAVLKQQIIAESLSPYPDGIRYLILLGMDDLDAYTLHRQYKNDIYQHNNAGQTAEKQGRIEDAIQHYQKAIALCPDTPFPYDRLRIIYTRQHEYKKAIAICKQYIADSKRIASAIRKELGDKEQAQSYLSDIEVWQQRIEKLKAKM